mmetsp:Transcript_29175/g.59172  ORF Transcript_29175/g.59172 Transcript_29175/m.59172 type:complete len:117 (+) Transcript_29175:2-352(+)
MKEQDRASKKRRKELLTDRLGSALKKKAGHSSPEDDPTHELYSECCDNPKFPGWRDDVESCGAIWFPDGSMAEVWRCLNCGEVPTYPNAPPVRLDDEERGGRYGGGNEGGEECVIQ